MSRPRALDLFCCAGGASKGLHDAGFDVVGVDIEFHKNYPFPMIVCDALQIERVLNIRDFDFIWASPPCQRFSRATPKRCRDNHPDLIEDTRQLLARSGARTCMENVATAPIRPDIILDGVHFGLPLERRRLFEVNFPTDALRVGPRTRPAAGPTTPRIYGPDACRPTGPNADLVARPEAGQISGPELGPTIDRQTGPVTAANIRPQICPEYGLPKAVSVTGGGGPGKGTMEEWCAAMEIDWMTRRELVEAVPPAYSEAIGRCALQHIKPRPDNVTPLERTIAHGSAF